MTKSLVAVLAALAATLLGIGLYLFQPWALVVDRTVDEAAPEVQTPPAEEAAPAAPPQQQTATQVRATGTFISHEHPTTGAVEILQLPDGSRILRVEHLDTSNGPDLKVWLTNAPVIEGRAGWGVFDDGAWVDLGPLKGNQGSQNYAIPAEVDLSDLSSVSIWCDRFNVSFGAAALA